LLRPPPIIANQPIGRSPFKSCQCIHDMLHLLSTRHSSLSTKY
jgi:hypothetical protein